MSLGASGSSGKEGTSVRAVADKDVAASKSIVDTVGRSSVEVTSLMPNLGRPVAASVSFRSRRKSVRISTRWAADAKEIGRSRESRLVGHCPVFV